MSRLLLLVALAAGVSGCGSSAVAADDGDRIYGLHYVVTLDPAAEGARVVLTLEQDNDYLRELEMPLLGGRLSDVEGDGEVTVRDGRVNWRPPEEGGRLSWFAHLRHLRGEDTYDAWVAPDWALFRGEDIIPSADTRTMKGARSDTRLTFKLPRGWSSVTPYPGNDDTFEIDNPERRFVTPTGWIVLGDLGVRLGTVSGIRVKVAGPTGFGIRRLDILAFLHWTLPEVLRVLPDFPERLTFISAGDPMWRGALSAPNSFFVHADRPLISENATSTMLHETVHVGLRLTAEAGADWIVEGLAEYYSLEMLRRSGTIGEERYRLAHARLRSWGRDIEELCTHRSSGSNTARAVTIISEVAGEIGRLSGGESSIDDVLRALASYDEKITVEKFRELVANIAGGPVEALKGKNLPGC